MLLREIFDHLTYGELSQLNIGGAKQGYIDDSNYDRMLTHVNMGLTTLHKRFTIKEGRFSFPLVAGTYTYDLNAMGNLGPGVLMKVERVLTDAGFELVLNDAGDRMAVRTPRQDTLVVPQPIVDGMPHLPPVFKTSALEIVFRENHPILQPGAGLYDANQVDIDLPYMYLEALGYFIASRIHNPIGMGQEFNSGNTYYAKYEAACQRLEVENYEIDQGSSDHRLRRNGWR